MKPLLDFLPVFLFFIVYKLSDIYTATAVLMASMALTVGFHWWRHRTVEKVHLASLALLLVFGGATLLFRDPDFIKWKPTVLNWGFACLFLGARWYKGGQPLLHRMLESRMELPDHVWKRLDSSWIVFFLLSGLLNIVVAYSFDEDTWVNFKLFGLMGLTLLFVFGQAFYMSRYMEEETEEPAAPYMEEETEEPAAPVEEKVPPDSSGETSDKA
ncbi:MAG: septation protein A [Magnetococcales bacterium]|nr:septation protein A [Magnetococcales bacterium]